MSMKDCQSGQRSGDMTLQHHCLRGLIGRLRGILFSMLGLMFLAGTVRGEAIKGEIESVGIGGINGAHGIYRIGSWVPVQVRLQNMTPGPIECRLGVQSNE